MRTGLGVLLLSFLTFACGKTSEDRDLRGDNPPDGNPHGGNPPGGNAGGAGPGELPLAGAAGRGSGGNSPGGMPNHSYVDLSGSPLYTRVQRLTNRQWENTVTDILHLQKPPGLSTEFKPPIVGVTAFDNNEQVLFVDQDRFKDFETGAEAVAALATGSPEALAALYAGTDAAGFIRTLGRRAFRRPLSADEEAKYQSVFDLGERSYGPGFANGAALVIRALLESPHFLYRTELGPAGDPLSSYELASKLSFWLLGTTPSDALLDAAAAGKFVNDDTLVATAREMLEDPRATAVMRDFHGQLMHVSSFEGISKVGVADYDPAVNSELVLASYAFFDRLFVDNRGLRELLTSNQAYVGPGLARLYGVTAPAGALELRDVGASRAGYFMQVPFLLRWSANADPNSIQRGLQIERAILCGPPRTPPAGIPTLPAADMGQKTNRERVSQFNSACGGSCHRFIDPLGFALENFDGLGRTRELDNGLPVDTTGSYPLAEGDVSFADGKELMNALARSEQVHTCYSKQVTSYALGRDLGETDRPLLESLATVSESQSLKEVIIALVQHPAFRTRESVRP